MERVAISREFMKELTPVVKAIHHIDLEDKVSFAGCWGTNVIFPYRLA